MGWVEKRLRGAKVFVLVDDAGKPQSGADNRVEIVYRPGGKPYRAALQNLEDLPDAKPLSDVELHALAGTSGASGSGSSSASDGVAKSASPPRPKTIAHELTAVPTSGDALHVYTDGACTGNPGPMGIGVVILDPMHEIAKDGRQDIHVHFNH